MWSMDCLQLPFIRLEEAVRSKSVIENAWAFV